MQHIRIYVVLRVNCGCGKRESYVSFGCNSNCTTISGIVLWCAVIHMQCYLSIRLSLSLMLAKPLPCAILHNYRKRIAMVRICTFVSEEIGEKGCN